MLNELGERGEKSSYHLQIEAHEGRDKTTLLQSISQAQHAR